jgi:hypothetical protein
VPVLFIGRVISDLVQIEHELASLARWKAAFNTAFVRMGSAAEAREATQVAFDDELNRAKEVHGNMLRSFIDSPFPLD